MTQPGVDFMDWRLAKACGYCDREFDPGWYGSARTRDHIVPKSMAVGVGPQAGRGNEIAACGACNGFKAALMPSGLRALAEEHRKRAALLDQMADRVERLIHERGLLPEPKP